MGHEIEFNRRAFLKVLGASGAAAALVGCGAEPPEKLIPYLVPAEEIIPGEPVWYASTCRECPAGCGIVMKTREGRAIKAEGNPSHPINSGALCARGQASLQGLYNPDRVREPLLRSPDGMFHPISWEEAEQRVVGNLVRLRGESKTEQIAFMTSLVGPSLRELIDRWLGAIGSPKRIVFERISYEGLRTANDILFGRDMIPRHSVAKSELIVSFGADFLETWISPVEHARGFGAMRSYRQGKIGHFCYVGPRLSLTGANADEWIPTRPGDEGLLTFGMLHTIVTEGLGGSLPAPDRKRLKALVESYSPKVIAELTGVSERKIIDLARMFATVRPSLAVGGGNGMSPNDTAASLGVGLLNYVCGNIGETVEFLSYSSLDAVNRYNEILQLVDGMNRGEISLLFLHRANPVFSLPEKGGFRDALKKVSFKVAFSEFLDETTKEADLILPMHDPLESWGDYSPWDGIYGLTQPVMQPLFQAHSLGDVLLSLAKKIDPTVAAQLSWATFYEYLRESWRALQRDFGGDEPFETFWQQAVRQGGVWREGQKKKVNLKSDALRKLSFKVPSSRQVESELYLHLYPSIKHYDGRGANRPWLQELPDPITHITWDSWVEIHPETAKTLGIDEGSILRITSPHGAIEAPAHLYEGIRRDTVALPLGQGHTVFGRYAGQHGSNPIALLPSKPESFNDAISFSSLRVQIQLTAKRCPLASTAGSTRQEGRGIAQAIGLSALARTGLNASEKPGEGPQMRARHGHPENRWGMVVDLNACIGCSACMVACSAENNVPMVGKDNVLAGREMFWIRIERYVETDRDHINNRFVPMLCQQCDNAPCEPVCPVYASYHRPDGLNAQVYNRCVGTRYCSNNCPYKVRRFNWFEYEWPEPLNFQLNPDVTVRSKGVMEKCTFCFQRIRAAKDRAKDEGRTVKDGEVTPACVQTCPTSALVFGDLKDPESKASKLSRDPRRYRILEELNTQPAITYLKKIRRDKEG